MMAWLQESYWHAAVIAFLTSWTMLRIREATEALCRIGRAAETIDKLLSEQLERERKAAKKDETG